MLSNSVIQANRTKTIDSNFEMMSQKLEPPGILLIDGRIFNFVKSTEITPILIEIPSNFEFAKQASKAVATTSVITLFCEPTIDLCHP